MLFVSASSTNIVHGHSLETGMPEMSEKKYQNINIDDDFSDYTVIVVLSKIESLFKILNKNSCASVRTIL